MHLLLILVSIAHTPESFAFRTSMIGKEHPWPFEPSTNSKQMGMAFRSYVPPRLPLHVYLDGHKKRVHCETDICTNSLRGKESEIKFHWTFVAFLRSGLSKQFQFLPLSLVSV